jgi:hypothetical protein
MNKREFNKIVKQLDGMEDEFLEKLGFYTIGYEITWETSLMLLQHKKEFNRSQFHEATLFMRELKEEKPNEEQGWVFNVELNEISSRRKEVFRTWDELVAEIKEMKEKMKEAE